MNVTTNLPFMVETIQYLADELGYYLPEYVKQIEIPYTPWVFSLLGSVLIGLSGILPLLVIPDDGDTSHNRKYILPFAKFCWFFLFNVNMTTIYESIVL